VTWVHKDLWRRDGKNFCVVVSRHQGTADREKGPHRWAVYAYIYPEHPRFSRIKEESMMSEGLDDLPFHGYCSFSQWHRSHGGIVTSKQVGADYDHLYDERYTHMATQDEARGVFRDASALFAVLEAEATS
jgi:hypothetical protein